MHWIRTAPFRLALGVIAGAVLALLALDLAATYPRSLGRTGADLSLPEVSGDRAPTVSFVETGRAQVPAHRLAQGVGMREREVIFRAAVVEHPQGAFAFGSGVAPGASDDALPFNVSNPFGRIEEGASLRDQLGDDVDLWRIVFPTLRWYHLGGATELPEVQTRAGRGDRWAAISGPWPRRYAYDSALAESLAPRGMRFEGPRYLGSRGSLDVFGDGSVVLLEYRGVSAAEIACLVSFPSGRRVLLVGDAVWLHEQVARGLPRTPWATWSLERNRFQAAYVIRVLQRAQSSFGVEVVPLLDGALELPLFPERWE